MNTFFKVLFDPDDSTCFANEAKGTKIIDIPAEPEEYQFFSINAIDSTRDHAPTEKYHHEKKPRRADANVTKFRNILLEIDDMPIEEQMDYISELALPFSTCVYSGSKSLHFIISLEQPLETKKEYDALVRRIHRAVNHADSAAKNASRLSRVPNAIRDNGRKQDLLIVNQRIPLKELLDWLEDQDIPEYSVEEPTVPGCRRLPVRAWSFYLYGAPNGKWNNELFKATCDAARAGYTLEEAKEKAKRIHGILDASDISTIKSAYSRVMNDAVSQN